MLPSSSRSPIPSVALTPTKKRLAKPQPPQRSFLQRWNEVPSPVAKSLESFIQDPNLVEKLKIVSLPSMETPVVWRSRDAAELCIAVDPTIFQWLPNALVAQEGEWTVLLDEDFDAKAALAPIPLPPPHKHDDDDDDQRIERSETTSSASSSDIEENECEHATVTTVAAHKHRHRPKSILKKSVVTHPMAPVMAVGSSQFSLRKDPKRCINDLAKVKVALNCDHMTNNSFHSLGTAAYSCVRCGVRIDSSSKAYLFVQALDVAMFEYPLLTLRPKLLQLLSRLEIGLEDLQSFCRQHRVEVETTAALLIQRMALLHIRRKRDRNAASQVLDSMKAFERRQRRRQCARELLQLQCRIRRKPIKLQHIVETAVSLAQLPIDDIRDDKFQFTAMRGSTALGAFEQAAMTPASEVMMQSSSQLTPPLLASGTTSSCRLVVESSPVVLPRTSPDSPEIYRCFAPQCGGQKFHNKKWFAQHMDKHATAKKRRQDESAFLARMRSQALPALRQHVIVPPPVPLPTPNCRLPQLNNPKSASMLMQLVRLDASCASDAQVIRIHNDDVTTNGMVLGRSAKHCDVIVDCPKYPGLVSKQHLRVIVVENTAVMVEDLGSKNGTYVNGNKQNQRTELHVGDTIELGRVKHRTESGVIPRFAVDDGTGVVWIDIQSLIKSNPSLNVRMGEYVMIIGPVLGSLGVPEPSPERIQAHQVIPLAAKDVHRECLWFLEVIEYWNHAVRTRPIEIDG
ncbi:hypothetical protein DYB30_010452 [Aphanomyces astaci]|uniref:FHA domain-containing protein n=1 Tax=Aphanomyces astaci TaxID=112090 RepID=A0A397CRF8_APHAT|nr:hypothetical protein DYB30_010452 [Aphanomyces astaci]